MTTAHNLKKAFAASPEIAVQGEFGWAKPAEFRGTEFAAAAAKAFAAKSPDAQEYGLIHINDLAKLLGTTEYDAEEAEYSVFPDGSALRYEWGTAAWPVENWAKNKETYDVD